MGSTELRREGEKSWRSVLIFKSPCHNDQLFFFTCCQDCLCTAAAVAGGVHGCHSQVVDAATAQLPQLTGSRVASAVSIMQRGRIPSMDRVIQGPGTGLPGNHGCI